MTQKQNKINELLDLENKVILITGALGQVGTALVNTFLDLGSVVIATDINKSGEINIENENHDYFKLDVSKPAEVRKVLDDIFAKYKNQRLPSRNMYNNMERAFRTIQTR